VRVTRATGSADFAGQYTITNKTLTNLTVEFAGAAGSRHGAFTFGDSRSTTPARNSERQRYRQWDSHTQQRKHHYRLEQSHHQFHGHSIGAQRVCVWEFAEDVATGATAMTFEWATPATYTPVNVFIRERTNAGDLTVNTTAIIIRNVTSSTIIPSKSANVTGL